MNTPLVNVGGSTGCIFEGELPQTYCFVPQDCIQGEGENLHVVEIDYVRHHWDERNIRSNIEVQNGNRLFPNTQHPIANLEEPSVQTFLVRLRQGRVETFC